MMPACARPAPSASSSVARSAPTAMPTAPPSCRCWSSGATAPFTSTARAVSPWSDRAAHRPRVLAGCDAEGALEALAEMALVDEAGAGRGERRGLAGGDQAARFREPELQEIGVGRHAVGAAELPAHVEPAHAGDAGQILP